MDKGINIAGGGSMFPHLDALAEETGLPDAGRRSSGVRGAGTGQMLTDFNLLRKISIVKAVGCGCRITGFS